ncbi:MAG: DUF167 domain-containing protein [Coriobacteriia bacterium]|nr:DUF167 domain-containing protein [Coriobacteriia bacterium]
MAGGRISVHVTPRSARDEVAGWRGGELSVRVTSPPEGGKANAAVCRAVAAALGVPKSSVSVARGHASRHKLLEVDSLDDEAIRKILGEPAEPLF